MRDAYGGTAMIYIFMVFFVLYISVIGVALNFAKIYRVKNNVINILEHEQYSGKDDGNISVKLSAYLANVPYTTKFGDDLPFEEYCKATNGTALEDFSGLGVCVIQKGSDNKHYYTVSVYHIVRLPIMDLKIPIVASGETKVIAG